jgi:hypothetical protein
MTNSLSKKPHSALGAGLLISMLMLGACALKETVDDTSGNTGVVVKVQDSSNVVLDFGDTAKTLFTDSGVFDLDDIRSKMSKRGLNPDSIEITGIAVTYDDSTKNFITANQGVKFILKLYLRIEGSGQKKLALYTLDKDTADFKAMVFDPKMFVFELGKQIFGSPEGFPDLLTSVKDTSKKTAWFIAELAVPDKLKAKGTLKLNMVVTVAGKV